MATVRNPLWNILPGRIAGLLVALLATGAVPDRVELTTMRGPDGRPVELKAREGGATALVFYSSECPISNAYSPTLNRLAAESPAGRVRFVGVCVDPDLADADVSAHAQDFGLKFPVVRDRLGALAARLGATVTPEAFVIDAGGRVRYHGRIDDQFAGRGKRERQPRDPRTPRRDRRRARGPRPGRGRTSRPSAARSPSPPPRRLPPRPAGARAIEGWPAGSRRRPATMKAGPRGRRVERAVDFWILAMSGAGG